MLARLWSFKEAKKAFIILHDGEEFAVSLDRVKPTYLGKFISKNVTSVFSLDPPAKETEESVPTICSG
ncbi:unnamed protein product [Hymenolepis diminuta]|uniref:Uncharacterized protein n=1 Tax=Hymenolepis diminuta TaxID=6216 RepID=A0A564YCZ4_HYMDI|nr:unnamed protein product [Hymenolepis diminuta]